MDHGKKKWRKDVDKKRLQLPENMNFRSLQTFCLLLGSGCGAQVVQGPCKADSGRGCAHSMSYCDVEARDSSIALVAFADFRSITRGCVLPTARPSHSAKLTVPSCTSWTESSHVLGERSP